MSEREGFPAWDETTEMARLRELVRQYQDEIVPALRAEVERLTGMLERSQAEWELDSRHDLRERAEQAEHRNVDLDGRVAKANERIKRLQKVLDNAWGVYHIQVGKTEKAKRERDEALECAAMLRREDHTEASLWQAKYESAERDSESWQQVYAGQQRNTLAFQRELEALREAVREYVLAQCPQCGGDGFAANDAACTSCGPIRAALAGEERGDE